MNDAQADDADPVRRALTDLPARSLEDLEVQDWGDPAPDDSYLVRTCMLLRRRPLGSFTDEDARIMIGQHIGLEVLVPLALGMLAQRPLAEGDMYPGALLGAVVAVPDEYWAAHPEQRAATVAIASRVDPGGVLDDLAERLTSFLAR